MLNKCDAVWFFVVAVKILVAYIIEIKKNIAYNHGLKYSIIKKIIDFNIIEGNISSEMNRLYGCLKEELLLWGDRQGEFYEREREREAWISSRPVHLWVAVIG